MAEFQFFRYFLALRPAAAVAGEIARARLHAGTVRTPVLDRHLHMTLAIVAHSREPRPELVALARTALVAHPLRAATIMLGSLRATPGTAELLPVGRHDALKAMQARLAALLTEARLPPVHPVTFRPHVTLGYHPAGVRAQRIAPIAWHPRELVLIESAVGLTRHRVLARWPLGEPDPDQYALDL